MKNQNRGRRKRTNKGAVATVIICGLLVSMLGIELGVASASGSLYKVDAQVKAPHITAARTVELTLIKSGEARVWLVDDVPPVPPTPPKPPKPPKKSRWDKLKKFGKDQLKKYIHKKVDKILK